MTKELSRVKSSQSKELKIFLIPTQEVRWSHSSEEVQ